MIISHGSTPADVGTALSSAIARGDGMVASNISVRTMAAILRSRGFAICRPDPTQKKPTYKGWSARSLEADDFDDGDQVGVQGGALSDGGCPGHSIGILDLDTSEAVELADEYPLLETAMSEGRPGKPRSHRYYLVPHASIPQWALSNAEQAARACKKAVGHPGPFKKAFDHRETKKRVIDFIGTGGQVVCPPAMWRSPDGTRTERREWTGGRLGSPAIVDFIKLWQATCELASACGAKIPDVIPRPPSPPRTRATQSESKVVERAVKYLATIPASVSGSGGHKAMMWAARCMVYGFDLGTEQAFQLLSLDFNTRCSPAWSDRELRHKVEDADRIPFGKPRGWLRDEPGPERSGRSSADPLGPATVPCDEDRISRLEWALAQAEDRISRLEWALAVAEQRMGGNRVAR